MQPPFATACLRARLGGPSRSTAAADRDCAERFVSHIPSIHGEPEAIVEGAAAATVGWRPPASRP